MPWKALSSFAFLSILAAFSASAGIQPYPNSFSVQEIRANGTTLHVRVGGTGPAVVLLHGFADTGDMWAPLASRREHWLWVSWLHRFGRRHG